MSKFKNGENPFATVFGLKDNQTTSPSRVSKRKTPDWARNKPILMKKNLSVYLDRSIAELFETAIRDVRAELPKALAAELRDNTIVELIFTYIVNDYAAGVNQSSIIKQLVNDWAQTAGKK